MKIVQLIYSLSSGGAERFVVSLANQLANDGHEVVLCMLLDDRIEKYTFNKHFLSSGVKFVSLRFSEGFSLTKVIKVERFIKSEAPDIVHCHLNVIPYIFRLAFFKKGSIRFIHTIHNIAEKASGIKLQKYINRFFYKSNLIIPVAISDKCKESFMKFNSFSSIDVVENGCIPIVPSTSFDTIKCEIDEMKNNPETKVFIHVARCHPQKNQKMLIEAFNVLSKRKVDFILIIIGAGFDSDDGIKLKQKACSEIYFLGEKQNVGDYLLCSNAFCLSSIYEGMPISLLEAMSCGVVPICTSVGGIPDAIEDGRTGYLSENLSLDAYIDAILKYLKKPINKDNIINVFNKRYSIKECAKKYLEVYCK